MRGEIWVPYLRDAFDKEEKTESEHSKWLHSSETVYLKKFFSVLLNFFLILLFINASFIVMYFLTNYFLYNGHYLVIICIW